MRKKTHISLAKLIKDSMKTKRLHKHRRAFYVGSIWPDCVPSFLTRKHTMEESYGKLKEEIIKVTDAFDAEQNSYTYFYRHLGIVTHYLADICTYPHNEVFEGGMREHCSYEKRLKAAMQDYMEDCSRMSLPVGQVRGIPVAQDIFRMIERMHAKYLIAVSEVEVDCKFSVALCQYVVSIILQIAERRNMEICAA